MKNLATLDAIKQAGIDTSGYRCLDGVWYLTATDAVKLVSYINDREINVKYLVNPVRQGRLHPLKLSARFYLYPLDEVARLEVRTPGRRLLPFDELSASGKRRRKQREIFG